MSANLTTVTHADGSVSKRKSKTMTYTHAIEVGPAPAEALAKSNERRATDFDMKAAKLREAASAGKFIIRNRGFSGPVEELVSHEAKLPGTDIYTLCSADGRTESYRDGTKTVVKVGGYLREGAINSAEHYEEQAAKLRAEAVEIREAGKPVGGYGVVRWSSSAMLATKALSSFKHYSDQGYAVRVVPVDAPKVEPLAAEPVGLATAPAAEVAVPAMTEEPIEVEAESYVTRESWLLAGVDKLRPIFAEVGCEIPAIRVSCGWPGGRGKKAQTIGECWPTVLAEDGVVQSFISPVLDEPVQVLECLTHEVVHAVDDCKNGHKAPFKKIATGVGLTGKMTATVAGEELKAKLKVIAAQLGPYPHAKLRRPQAGKGGKTQKNRNLLWACPDTGFKVRTAQSNVDTWGAPLCPCHKRDMEIG